MQFDFDVVQFLIIVGGYLFTFATSGLLIKHLVGFPPPKPSSETADAPQPTGKYNIGMIIGKCENFITITFILADAVTGLALVFTAKSIVRGEDMRKNPTYYLGGTLVNFSYSILMGFLILSLLKIVGRPL